MVLAQEEGIVGGDNHKNIMMSGNQENSCGDDNNNKRNAMMLIKGKRTKRARPLSPLALTMSTSTGDEAAGTGSATSEEWTAATNSTMSEEEEDMAHCLILLAQGSNNQSTTTNNNISIDKYNSGSSTISNGKSATMSTTPSTPCNTGTTSYECKTCNRSFQSFQALGGHRASHKKPKLNITLPEPPKKASLMFSLLKDDYSPVHNHQQQSRYDHQLPQDHTTLTLQMATSSSSNHQGSVNKVKVHECSICGAEFSSGQALGGHMRRHRPIGMSSSSSNLPSPSTATAVRLVAPEETTVATRSLLTLDLNLPAPEDEQHHHHRETSSKFVFPSNDKTLVFTASSLVDCHY